MHPAVLPGRTEDARDCVAKPVMGIGDHQLDALQPALGEPLQEGRPERLGFRGADAETDNLAAAFGVDRDGDYRRHGIPRKLTVTTEENAEANRMTRIKPLISLILS